MALFCLARRDESRRQLSLASFDIPFKVQMISNFSTPIACTLKYDSKWQQVIRGMAIGGRSCGLYLGADVIESPTQREFRSASHQHHALRFLAKPFSTTDRCSSARHNEYAYRHWDEARHPDEIRQKLPSGSIWRDATQLYTPLPSCCHSLYLPTSRTTPCPPRTQRTRKRR